MLKNIKGCAVRPIYANKNGYFSETWYLIILLTDLGSRINICF